MAGSTELKLILVTPSKKILETEVPNVYFPSSEGILGILPDHVALVCKLGTGVLHFTKNNITTFYMISGGLAEVKDNVVTILADVAEDPAHIDLTRAEKALERARTRLRGDKSLEAKLDMERAAVAEAKAVARLQAASSGASKH